MATMLLRACCDGDCMTSAGLSYISRPCPQCLARTAASASVAVADCRLADRQLLVATFHLKAKPGAVNDAIRHSQVSTQCTFCTACSVASGTDAALHDRG